MTLASRIGVMNRGEIVQIGTPTEIYEFPQTKFVADFIGSVNMFEGQLIEDLPDHVRIKSDELGGVIVTDWYTNPNTPGERVKLTVSIIDQDLRADALRVAASRQVNQNGAWVDAPVAAATVQKLEDIILTRARDLRRTTVGG